jgi:hypothetical protein
MCPTDSSSLSNAVLRGHIVIFDWDDTFSPSTAFGHTTNVDDVDLTRHKDDLDRLERSVIQLLDIALKRTTAVHIVTNAEQGWVEQSARKWLPNVVGYFDRIKICSARSQFQHKTDKPTVWKYYAIEQLLLPWTSQQMQVNVISLGDCHSERFATQCVMRCLGNSLCKTIKMVDEPSIADMYMQLERLYTIWNKIVDCQTHLDLEVRVNRSSVD